MLSLLFRLVMLLKATQVYCPLSSFVSGDETKVDMLDTMTSLKYHVKWLGGFDSAWQLSVTLSPLFFLRLVPETVTLSGPSEHKDYTLLVKFTISSVAFYK